MLFRCIYLYRFPCFTRCLVFLDSSDEGKIGWRKLATTGDVIRILIFSLACLRSIYLFFLSFFFYYHLTYIHRCIKKVLRADIQLYTEDVVKIIDPDQRVSAVIFIRRSQQLKTSLVIFCKKIKRSIGFSLVSLKIFIDTFFINPIHV